MSDQPLRIFISYRREDARAYAGWLAFSLEEPFGRPNIFRDVETLEPGVDFMVAIDRWISRSDVVLVLIGPHWTTATGDDGPRLHALEDPVRVEVATALKSGTTVIPVLVADAVMPKARELPAELADLTRRNAHSMSDARWRQDLAVLVSLLRNIEAAKGSPRLTGQEILDRHGSGGKAPDWIGRSGGPGGRLFREDVTTGKWRTQSYEVKFGGDLPGRNWFSLREFLGAVGADK